MILVKVEKNKIEIKGHADYEDLGKDIVCASVSSIVTTTINGIISIDEDSIEYSEKEGFVSIKLLKDKDVVNKLIFNMIDLLKQLESQYPKNIKIKEGV